jgi:hypothetical protein
MYATAVIALTAGRAYIDLGLPKKALLRNGECLLEIEEWSELTNSDFHGKYFLFLKVNNTEHLYFC